MRIPEANSIPFFLLIAARVFRCRRIMRYTPDLRFTDPVNPNFGLSGQRSPEGRKVNSDGSRKIRRKQVCRRKLASGIFASGNFAAVKFCTPSIYPPPCTLLSTVHCPIHLHRGLPLRCTLPFAY